ncbi:C2 domain-containing protein 3 isoform X2 [Boleophthalmus pectinirostris]|uniref:C2 domain-containing protein 3 isoform X2 n=1 Tax=Boleophthalmus pectinirostris TaxID=150288 RepID=UPI0024314762|nr:C2 domain-containing protein 3 isoform X2 [Boleophthalmus pectinirostris]
MKSRKPRLAKAGTSKRKVSSDISPSTSLPPLVEGQLRCFLRVTVSRVLWTMHKPPSNTFVRLRWWGETSSGTHFFPRDGSQASQKSVKTTTRFPIRCGPKQFTSYLTDMGYIVLEVLTKPDHLPIARAQVAGIPRLSLSHPISGFYTLVSPTSEKMGELQVSLCLEPLTEAYDSSSSCPPTDISIDKAPQEMSSEPKVSAGSGKESSESTSANTPRGKDHLYFQRIEQNKALPENQTLDIHPSLANPADSGTDPTNDLLSVILERGNKLRNAMVVSAVDTDINSAPTVMDGPVLLSHDNTHFHTKSPSPPPGTLLQNILLANTNREPSCGVTAVCDHGLDTSDIDQKAVDLLLGSTSPLPLWDDLSVLSIPSSLGGDSELNDPQYDQSLLENLFYKSPAIDEQAANTELGVQTQQQKHSTSGAIEQPLTQPETTNGVKDMVPHSLSAEQLNRLSSIQLMRVCVDSLTVPSEKPSTSSRNNSKGKPPRPLSTKKCTYFVEYVLPRVSAIHHKNAEEVTRVVSSRITGEVVRFCQRSLFPVHFSTAFVKLWWETDLIFRIYLRRSDQKKPILFGRAVHPLSRLLLSESLSQSLLLPVSMEEERETKYIGPLKVTLELVTGKNDSQVPIKTPAQRDTTPWDTTAIPVNAPSGHKKVSAEVPVVEVSVSSPRLMGEAVCPESFHTSPSQNRDPLTEESTNILLHALLMVPDGRDFQCSPLQSLNLYLNCKFFWCDETVRSHVAWGQTSPTFNFVQVTPVTLTSKLLERMKNNVMVIEVWQKIGSPKQDHLLGLVKLPLHQFYMSFRDVKIAHLLLQAQYPVLGVDCYMPVIDVFSGNCKGNLRVILAMGQTEQISALQSARGEEYHSPAPVVRPVYLLDHHQHSKQHKQVTRTCKEIMKEHVFVVKVEKVVGLTPLQSTVWGEADCYIQYTFLCQEGDLTANTDLIESTINLKSFRTTTTLCVPDPLFGHTERHVLLAPEGVPIQKVLLSSLSCQGLSGRGGMQFEVWCRYYYPNVRDQLVAKGTLPLSKLCAMVTMQRLNNEVQRFSLPLIPWTDTDQQLQPSGLLDVCVEYKHRPVRPEGQMGRGAASRVVTLVIQIHRASGLKSAARAVAETNERFCYYTSVGVNSYITAQLSFLPERETRCTRIVARSFSPEFDHYMEMSCDLLLQRSIGESISLAEQLEQASAIFTVWNRESRKGVEASQPKDVQLGTVKVPLSNLIYKRTGISGWFGVHAFKQASSEEQPILVGGVEISIRFSHHSDRERVLKAAQCLGWEMAHRVYLREEDEESWEENLSKISLIISVPRAWIPVHCLLLPGLREMQRSTYCYFRYKFYDQEAFCSHMKHPVVEEENIATVSFEGSATVELKRTQPLIWYLREEMLEIQMWVAFTKDKTQRPCDTDRLVGSAFLDLSALAKISKQKLTLSGVYPLFRRSAADLQGAALRVHITLALGSGPRMAAHTDTDEEVLLSDEVHDTVLNSIERTQKTVQHIEIDKNESFPVTITVDKAMHLNLTDQSEGTPCCCVSYVSADSSEPVFTAVISNNDNPVWDHQHECRLPKDLLVDPQQSLVFKVWYKGEIERVIGFASVDLMPLLCGLPSVCGWYNITDFSGHCHGQLKVSITPVQRIHDLRLQRKSACEEKLTNSSGHSITYHTTATYSSFPSHISRYPEQKISSPDHTEILFSERSSVSDRHFEHMDKVRLYHQSIHEQITAPCASGTGDLNPSSSILFSALRKKLGELDNIQRHFSRKLSTPTFPTTDEDVIHKQEAQKTSEMDTPHLLLKSNMLIGQVSNIISGLQGQHLETIPSIPQSNLNSPVEDPAPQTPHGTPESSHNTFTTSQQPLLTNEEIIHSSHEEDFQSDVNALSEEDQRKETDDEEGTGCKIDQDAEDDDAEDYEETVVKPRHLNELTSLTDKTSPWTSILSDPELVSLESIDTEISHGEKDEQLTSELPIKDASDNTNYESEENSKGDNISEKEESDTDDESPRTCESLHLKIEDKEPEFNSESEDEPDGDFSTKIHNPISAEKINDPQPKLPVFPEVPNFFLSPHQMEASMKVIRLAPSFSQSPVDLGPSAVPARGPRLRPNMSPSSLRKETDRIAKIFAAHFDEAQRN